MPLAYIFDLDGVLYRGNEAVDGAADTIARLRARRPPAHLFFLTNNSTQSRQNFADKLTNMGMPVSVDEIVTSSSATAEYLLQTLNAQGRTALVVGGAGLREELMEAGLLVIPAHSDEETEGESFDFVVAGLDREFTYRTLTRAQQAILQGATFLATNRDGQFPVERGGLVPGAGSIVAAIEAASDTAPLVIGKPETLGLQTILSRARVRPSDAVMVGDRLDTDILCGNRLGVPTVLMLTGVTTATRAVAAPLAMRPGRILANLRELD